MVDHKRIACDWLHLPANQARWSTWIQPPPQCTAEDFSWTTSQCDTKSDLYTITYAWLQPKACVGGVELPTPDQVTCEFIAVTGSWMLAAVVLAAILICVCAVALVLRAIEERASQQPITVDAAAAAAVAVARKQTAGAASSVAIDAAASSGAAFTAATPYAVTGPPSFSSRLSVLRRQMAILRVSEGAPFNMLLIGCILLLVSVFLSAGWLSESHCWARYALIVFGLMLLSKSLTVMLYTLDLQLRRSLLSTRRNLLTALFMLSDATMLATTIGVAVSAKGNDRMLLSTTVDLPGGGSIQMTRCTGPPLWLSLVHLAVNVPVLSFAIGLLLRVIYRVHLASYFAAAQSYAAVAPRSKGAAAASSVSRVHATTANSLILSMGMLCLLCGLLLFTVYMPIDPLQLNFLTTYTTAVVIAGVPALLLALFGPSLARLKQMQRSEAKATRRTAFVSPLDGRRERAATAAATAKTASSNSQSTDAVSREESESETSNDSDNFSVLPLAAILRDPVLLLHFRRFATSHFDAEPLHFLLNCQRFYKRMNASTLNLNQLIDELTNIADQFIVPGAPEQVNISSQLRGEVLEKIQSLRFVAIRDAKARLKPAAADMKSQARECLHAAVMEVYYLVSLNSHPRFLNSSSHMARLQRLIGWCDEFGLLDLEEQAATLDKLRDAHTLAREGRKSDDTASGGSAGGHGEGSLLEQPHEAQREGTAARKKESQIAMQQLSVPGSPGNQQRDAYTQQASPPASPHRHLHISAPPAGGSSNNSSGNAARRGGAGGAGGLLPPGSPSGADSSIPLSPSNLGGSGVAASPTHIYIAKSSISAHSRRPSGGGNASSRSNSPAVTLRQTIAVRMEQAAGSSMQQPPLAHPLHADSSEQMHVVVSAASSAAAAPLELPSASLAALSHGDLPGSPAQ